MGRKRVRTLLLAGLTIMLCMALLVGGTYALWSKDVSVTNHLVAGNLDLKLERIALSKTMLDNDTGYMKDVVVQTEANDPVDLTTGSGVNVFGIEEGELVAPTSCYEATLKLTNNGSVAFTYQIIIRYEDLIVDGVNLSEALKDQLMVSVNNNTAQPLSDFEDVDNQVVIASYLVTTAGANTTKFTVKIEFKNDDNVNNAAMNKEVEFDLIVKAVQLTSDPNPASNGD